MALSVESFRKVFYDLRPGKQIERRLLLDAFQHLITLGFPIRSYKYVGFGSIFFYDFIMLYRYLGIADMVSLEIDSSIEQRVRYNKPFDNIEVRIESAASYIPTIDRDRDYIVWFDYDQIVNSENLSDVKGVLSRLGPGSIFIITVDAFPPLEYRKRAELRKYITVDLRNFLPDRYPVAHIKTKNLAIVSRDLIASSIQQSMSLRQSVEFRPLWSITYNDSRPMYTFGGMVVNREQDKRLEACDEFYYRKRFDDTILEIEVPRLTKKERIALDHELPNGSDPFPVDFGIKPEEISAYTTYHRYFPSYSELF